MFLQANPGKGKTDEEKEEMRKKYKVGDKVMPKIELKLESSAEAEDRRMIEEIRELSLREVGVRGAGTHERGTRQRQRDGDRDTRDDEARRRRREQERRRRNGEQRGVNEERGRALRDTDSRSQARHIEHQSSLRSLISNSDVDSAEMEAEILRQIMDEGLLDGIDLNNLDVSQEDELSERIADAYRRRHGQTLRSRGTRTESSGESTTRQRGRERPRHREQRRSSPTQQVTQSSRPPISRPHLFEAYPTGDGHRRRTSSEHRRQTSPAPTSANRASTETQRRAARSATDLSNTSQVVQNFRARPAETTRRTSDHARQRSADSSPRIRSHSRQASASSNANTQSQMTSPQVIERPTQLITQQGALAPTRNRPLDSLPSAEGDTPNHERHAPYPMHDSKTTAAEPSSGPPSRLAANPYIETFVSCNRCGKANIAYDLHYNCAVCEKGRYNLCNRCYRLSKGCLHWYGFGKGAMRWYERQTPPGGYPPNHPLPHVLQGHRYLNPEIEIRLSSGPRHTIPDPAKRLQSGFFCSSCSAFANDCFWKCEQCNDGEWGFCNPCVNQGKCCTHPLLPIAHSSVVSRVDRPISSTPRSSFFPASPSNQQVPKSESVTLTFNTACDICTLPIPPSATRFHCPQCNNGDYDICTSCYLSLVSSHRISTENSDKGWRRCLQGHRMIIVGFEESSLGQRRIVVRDLVGGQALRHDQSVNSASSAPVSQSVGGQRSEERRRREDDTLTTVLASTVPTTPSHSPSLGSAVLDGRGQYPPSGGVGLTAVAMWAYWPAEGAGDELGFPKGAEIREAVDINGYWFEGFYCGRGGLWPGAYARVIR